MPGSEAGLVYSKCPGKIAVMMLDGMGCSVVVVQGRLWLAVQSSRHKMLWQLSSSVCKRQVMSRSVCAGCAYMHASSVISQNIRGPVIW